MKIITVVGARPQFIKAATVAHAIYSHNLGSSQLIEDSILHTGQHYDSDMSDVFFEELEISAPVINLGVRSERHGAMTGQILEGVEDFLLLSKPDWVLVYGDTNSTLAGALAAAKLGIKVAHVEAGLRCGNKHMPEEINRLLVDHLSDKLFCPTINSVENLANEGVFQGVHHVGDVMLDALMRYSKLAQSKVDITKWGLSSKNYVVSTIHRAENTDSFFNLGEIVTALHTIADEIPVLLPLHPRTLARLTHFSIKIQHPNIQVVKPLSYLEMLCILMSAKAIITDSGGLQKEACFLRIPCVTTRNETEWVELVNGRANQLTGANAEKIISAYKNLENVVTINPSELYGDGCAAKKIVNHLLSY